jgi:hypothetical protein
MESKGVFHSRGARNIDHWGRQLRFESHYICLAVMPTGFVLEHRHQRIANPSLARQRSTILESAAVHVK